MNILINKKEIDRICELVVQNKKLFSSFNNVYLFGSILTIEKNPNDIDVLLIYKKFSKTLITDLDNICSVFNEINRLTVDLTVLSVEEEKETKFIKKLNTRYLKLK